MWYVMSYESSFTIFSTSGRVHMWREPREQYRTECWTPTVRGSGFACMVWALPLEGGAIANQYKAVLSYHLYLVMKQFYPVSSWMRLPPSSDREGSPMVWWVWNWCESLTVAITVTRSLPSLTAIKILADVLDSALHRHHQNYKWGNVFKKNGVSSLR